MALLTLLRRASALPVLVASAALFALMAMTFTDVVLRSAADAPIQAATEITRILMAIIVFSVLPVVTARNGHIAVDLTDGLFRKWRLTRLRDGLIHLLCGVALIWPVQRIGILAERSRSYGDVTEYLAIQQFYVDWFIAILTGMTAAVLIVMGLLHLFAPRLVKADA